MQSIQYIKKAVYIVIILVSFYACQESFVPEDLESTKSIPVFEGTITDQPGPYKVVLSWAKPFSTKGSSTTARITNAKVYIKDDIGGSELLTDRYKNGEYVTAPNVTQGTIGRTYHLYVKLSNGYIYESVPTKLEQPEVVDSMYAEPGTYEYATTNGMGEMVKKTYPGIYVYTDINVSADQTKYYKFSNTLIWQTIRTEGLDTEFPYPVFYRAVSNPNDLPNVKSSILYDNKQVVRKHQIIFIPYITDPSFGPDSLFRSPYMNAGWVVINQMKTISRESYNYYQAVHDQLKSSSQLFDPIPTQIKGNIICRSDTTQMAIGLFEVYTKSVKSKAFYWIPDKRLFTEDVIDPGPLVNDTFKYSPAPYWVEFSY